MDNRYVALKVDEEAPEDKQWSVKDTENNNEMFESRWSEEVSKRLARSLNEDNYIVKNNDKPFHELMSDLAKFRKEEKENTPNGKEL